MKNTKYAFQKLFPLHVALDLAMPTPIGIRCKNPACRACGNPAYPECMDSCPLFDD